MSTRLSVRPGSAFVAGAVVALVLGTGTAYAANGGVFRLGKPNSATATTTLTNTHGTALSLSSKAGQPPLRVNQGTKVPNLNADKLDGVDSTRLARVTKVGSIAGGGFVDDGGTTDPADDAMIAVAVCPTGSQVVGGGGADYTTDGTLFYSEPAADGPDQAWVVVSSTTDLTPANMDNVEAYARCWNPLADVPDDMGTMQAKAQAKQTLSPAVRRAVERAAAKK